MSLNDLALKYGTDKSSDIHNYAKLYEQYFEPIRNEPIRLLEIGVQEGKSLKMWKEYFPAARIVGLDIANCKQYVEDRIVIVEGDQRNTKHLYQATVQCGPFDVVIDDGSHRSKDILISFEYLFPLLKPGGLYVIEDIHVCYWDEYEWFAGKSVLIKKLKELVDAVHSSGKSSSADRGKDDTDKVYDHFKREGKPMTWWEKNVEFMHLYRSIAFIKRTAC